MTPAAAAALAASTPPAAPAAVPVRRSRPRPARSRGPAAVRAVLHDPSLLGVAVQPIVDVARGAVAGYEVLARPDERLGVGPAALFGAARHDVGCLGELHVLALRAARSLRDSLPADTFLTVNVDPRALGLPVVLAELLGWGPLGGVVVELLEGEWPEDARPLRAGLDAVTSAGALVALDDVGSAWAGLAHVLEVRPALVKVDRGLADGLGRDPAAEAAVRAVGELAATLDAWVCLEGVERPEQLAAAARLRVPLAQGYLLGRPGRAWPQPDLGPLLGAGRQRTSSGLGALAVAEVPGELELERDAHGRPVAVVQPMPDGTPWRHPAMTLSAATRPQDALHRAMARLPRHRFAPLVVTGPDGRPVGLVPVDVLAAAVARLPAQGPAATHPAAG